MCVCVCVCVCVAFGWGIQAHNLCMTLGLQSLCHSLGSVLTFLCGAFLTPNPTRPATYCSRRFSLWLPTFYKSGGVDDDTDIYLVSIWVGLSNLPGNMFSYLMVS